MHSTRVGQAFSCKLPIGWDEIEDSGKTIFVGPELQELIISESTITGSGSIEENEKVCEELFLNATSAAKLAASHPDLKIVSDLAEDSRIKENCWVLVAETKEGDVLFAESIFQNDRGVLLVTFEGPNRRDQQDLFFDFLFSVRSHVDLGE